MKNLIYLFILAANVLYTTRSVQAKEVEYQLLFAGFRQSSTDLEKTDAAEQKLRDQFFQGFTKGAGGAGPALVAATAQAGATHVNVIDLTASNSRKGLQTALKQYRDRTSGIAANNAFISAEQVGVGFFVIDDVLILNKDKYIMDRMMHDTVIYVVVSFHVFHLKDGIVRYSIDFLWPFTLPTYSNDPKSAVFDWIKSNQMQALLGRYFTQSAQLIGASAGFQQMMLGQGSNPLEAGRSYLQIVPKLSVGTNRADPGTSQRLSAVAAGWFTRHAARYLRTIPFYVAGDRHMPLAQRDRREQQLHSIVLSGGSGPDIRGAIAVLTGYTLQRAPADSTRQISFEQNGVAFLGDNLFPTARRTLTADIVTQRQPTGAIEDGDDIVRGSVTFTLRDSNARDLCGVDGRPVPARTSENKDIYMYEAGIDRGLVDDFAALWKLASSLSELPLFGPDGQFGDDTAILNREAQEQPCAP